jgi:hypothetical protein
LSERAFRWTVTGLAAAALAVRLLHAQASLAPPFGDVLVQDARVYHETARRLLGDLPPLPGPAGPSFMNVGYPWVLAAVGSLLGPAPRAVLLVQAVLGALACAAIALAARALLSSRAAGLAAGAAALLAATPLFYDGLLLTPSPTFACLALALWLLALHREQPTARLAAVAGASLALPILLRANAVLFVPLALAAVLRAAPPAARLRQAAALAASALLVPVAIVVTQGLAHGAWVPLSANAGMNLWVGNHRGATGVYSAASFLQDGGAEAEEAAFRDEARRRAGDPWLTLARSSAFWREEALHEIGADPARAAGLAIRKAALFWTGFEVKTNYSMAFAARRSPVLRALPLRFGSVAVLGAAGIALLLVARRPGGGLLAGCVVIPWLTCIVFFVSGEYRHAATPALLIGIGALAAGFTGAPWRARGAALLAGAGALGLAAWPRPELPIVFAPTLDVRAHVRSLLTPAPGAPPPGPAEFERALAITAWQEDDLVVRDARLWVHVRAARALGRPSDATAALDEAGVILAHDLRPRPGLPPESFLRSLAAAVPARLRELAALPVVRQDPVLRARARLLGADDWMGASLAELRAAVAAAPHDPRPRAELGRALLATGERPQGLRELRASCLLWPEIPQCAFYVAESYAREGNLPQARRAATLALERDPGYAPAASLLRAVDAPAAIGQTPRP